MAINDFDWQLYPEAEKFISGLVRSFLDRNGYANLIRGEIENTSSTRFIDWVDSMEVPDRTVTEHDLRRIGYVKDQEISPDGVVYNHSGTFFPIVLHAENTYRLSIHVDDLERFLARGHLTNRKISGERNATLRSAELNHEGSYSICAVERHGSRTYDIRPGTDTGEYETAFAMLSARKRAFGDDKVGVEDLRTKIVALGDTLEPVRLADAFLRAERIYWQTRNRAGRVQSTRQELLGMGWGNHDHHTFRCSRDNFGGAITIFEEMGFIRRESFFAGAEAGWGAQVLEHPDSDLVVFADVDLGPDELLTGFADQELKPLEKLGTVGLWVGLHGESLLDSGMHHLAVGSDFKGMREGLKAREVVSMSPFSDFDFLKQSFTEAEHWTPPKQRVNHLLEDDHITVKQATKFIEHGALGSHLEIIQRDRGFKGFNQSSVSAIIRLTDPINQAENGA